MKPYGFKREGQYLEDYRTSEMTKMCACVEKSIQAAINKGDNEVEIVFTDGHHPLVPLEDAVNEIQDLLRASGFQVTKNRNIMREERGQSVAFPFSLMVRWNWEITTKKEKVDTPLGKVEVNTVE